MNKQTIDKPKFINKKFLSKFTNSTSNTENSLPLQ